MARKAESKVQTKLSRYMDTEKCGLSPKLVLVVKQLEIGR